MWSPYRTKGHSKASEKSFHQEQPSNETGDSAPTSYEQLAHNLHSMDAPDGGQHNMPRKFLTPVLPTFGPGGIGSTDDSGSCPTSPRRFYESEPLLVGALADRAQWWDYDASASSDIESDGIQSDSEEHERDYYAPEGGKPQNDAFCALDMLSRVWPRNQQSASLENGKAAAAAAQTSGAVLDEHVQGPELKDFAGGMEGDIMQAAAIASVSMDASDVEEVGYLEKLRQRVLAVSTVKEVTLAAGAARQPPRRAGVPKPDTRDSEGHTCPVHWFVADDPTSNIRFFSLQVPIFSLQIPLIDTLFAFIAHLSPKAISIQQKPS